jgi:hypothetical protein
MRWLFVILLMAGCGDNGTTVEPPKTCWDAVGNYYDMGCILKKAGNILDLDGALVLCGNWEIVAEENDCHPEEEALLGCLQEDVEYGQCKMCETEIYSFQLCTDYLW